MKDKILFIDFETRSEADLKDVGAHRYLTDNTTEMTLVSWTFCDYKDGTLSNERPAEVAEEMPPHVADAILDPTVLKVAHNAEFDMGVCKYLLSIDIEPFDWFDTAGQAAYYGHPRKLKLLAERLKTSAKGSQEELMIFSIPVRKATKPVKDALVFIPSSTVWNTKETHPREWEAFKEYARMDTEVMRECFKKMRMLPAIELFAMWITFEMNFNGIHLDKRFAKAVYERARFYEDNALAAAKERYGVTNLSSTKQVLAALLLDGVHMTTLNVKERNGIEHPLLELRDQATGSAFAKIPAAFRMVCDDDRLRGGFMYAGAHTMRWSGRGVQPQNFARITSPVSTDLTLVRDYQHLKEHMRLILGNAPGKRFTCADLSQIEIRVTSWLANCRWRMDAFKNGEDIYCRAAEKMFGIPRVEKGSKERQIGKCSELGFSYGGSENAIYNTNRKFYLEHGLAEVKRIASVWRNTNPEICALWRKVENGFREALKVGAAVVTCGTVKFRYDYSGSVMRIMLPSGRALFYRGAHLEPSDKGSDIWYHDTSESGVPKRIKVWGGVILNNIVQGISRDVMVSIMKRVHDREPVRMRIMGTVHDEIWYESSEYDRFEPLAILLEEMARPIPWAEGLITRGDGFTDTRYIK